MIFLATQAACALQCAAGALVLCNYNHGMALDLYCLCLTVCSIFYALQVGDSS